MNSNITPLLVAAAAMWATPGTGLAQAEPDMPSVPVAADTETVDQGRADTGARRPTSRLIEEIVVTAQKREENLQDVPISISAFSAETLDARGIVDPKDLPQVTPGLYIGANAGYTITYLRGVGSDAYLLGDPSVALYIDGVYFPFAHGQAQNFGSIERVEVLKGPQGTLFGRNAVGGAISVTTEAPSFSDAAGSVQVGYGDYNDLQTKAQINLPLGDSFAIGISGLYNSADNYRDGRVGGEPLPKEITKGARVRLRWAPIEMLDITLSGFRLEQSGTGTMFATNGAPSPVFSTLIQAQTGMDGVNDAPDYFSLENTVFYGQATLNLDAFDVKLIGSDQNVQTAALYDFDGSPTPLVFFEVPKQGADIQTAELQFLSNNTSWASDRLTWIFGYYYFQGRQGLDRVRFGVAGSVFGGLNDLLVRNALLGPILGRLGVTELLPETPLAADGTLQTYSNSVFGQGTYSFNDWLSLTLGLRAQDEKRTIVHSGGALDLPVLPDVPYTSFSGQSDTTRSLSPKVSFEFRPWDDGLVYTSFQQATKSSTYNVVNFLRLQVPDPVKPEKLTAYEIGAKKTLFDGTTSLSTAAFWYEIRNQQVQFLSLLAGGAVTFENAPAARIRGVDFDVTSELFPSVFSGLVLTFGGAYLDTEYTDFPHGQGFDNLGLYTRADYTGNRIPRSPKFSGTVGLSQTLEVPGGTVEIAGDYYYNSGFYYLAQNTAFDHEAAYGVLGAHVSYLYEPWRLRTTVFGKNLLDERYNYSKFTNDFGALNAVAPPVTYGIRLSWEF